MIQRLATTPPAGSSNGTMAGITLGQSLTEVGEHCRAAGHAWKQTPKGGRCAGPLDSTLARWHREVGVVSCAERICGMVFDVVAVDRSLKTEAAMLILRLDARYPKLGRVEEIPPQCRADGDTLMRCVEAGEAVIWLGWQVEPNVIQTVKLARANDGLKLELGLAETSALRTLTQPDQAVCDAMSGLFGCPSQSP